MSDMTGLTLRCAKHEVVGERLGRGAIFLPEEELFHCVCGTKSMKRDDGVGDWNGLWLEGVAGMRRGRGDSCGVGGYWEGGEGWTNAGCGAGGGRV